VSTSEWRGEECEAKEEQTLLYGYLLEFLLDCQVGASEKGRYEVDDEGGCIGPTRGWRRWWGALLPLRLHMAGIQPGKANGRQW
jgi:hypothetical protein